MAIHHSDPEIRQRNAPTVLAAVIALLIVSTAGAADRVVLGEYFTNLY